MPEATYDRNWQKFITNLLNISNFLDIFNLLQEPQELEEFSFFRKRRHLASFISADVQQTLHGTSTLTGAAGSVVSLIREEKGHPNELCLDRHNLTKNMEFAIIDPVRKAGELWESRRAELQEQLADRADQLEDISRIADEEIRDKIEQQYGPSSVTETNYYMETAEAYRMKWKQSEETYQTYEELNNFLPPRGSTIFTVVSLLFLLGLLEFFLNFFFVAKFFGANASSFSFTVLYAITVAMAAHGWARFIKKPVIPTDDVEVAESFRFSPGLLRFLTIIVLVGLFAVSVARFQFYDTLTAQDDLAQTVTGSQNSVSSPVRDNEFPDGTTISPTGDNLQSGITTESNGRLARQMNRNDLTLVERLFVSVFDALGSVFIAVGVLALGNLFVFVGSLWVSLEHVERVRGLTAAFKNRNKLQALYFEFIRLHDKKINKSLDASGTKFVTQEALNIECARKIRRLRHLYNRLDNDKFKQDAADQFLMILNKCAASYYSSLYRQLKRNSGISEITVTYHANGGEGKYTVKSSSLDILEGVSTLLEQDDVVKMIEGKWESST